MRSCIQKTILTGVQNKRILVLQTQSHRFYCALRTGLTPNTNSPYFCRSVIPPPLTEMPSFEIECSAMLTLADCAAEQIPLWLRKYHEDGSGKTSTAEDTSEKNSSCGGRKRASSVDGDAGRPGPSKLVKYEAGPMVFQVAPMPRRIAPLPKRGPSVHSSAIQDTVDLSWIPRTYRLLVPNDTLMHSRFMSECTYPMPIYDEYGTVKRKNCETRKEFLDNDEWAKVTEEHRVVCKGCDKPVALDRRNGYYYPNFWVKHRSLCAGIYTVWLQGKGMNPNSDKEWFRKHKQLIEED
ncbi:hypothetical protein DFS33DRAFT_1401484 [Desarmillaria ectypa]|nr:hypothetical protein DFS33DRAFT_1401484 [Desarmillaria ectypa]